jgi:hypothetical protein
MEAITPEDQKRINACDDYQSTKRIMRSCEAYRDHEVGTAVYIKENFPNQTVTSYVGQGYQNKEPAHKFIIIENDAGFVFAKRILASGKPGVEVTCLSIRYPSDCYELVVDSDYLDSMLLDTDYDPTSAAKDLARRKGKASRDNNKLRIMFDTPKEAYDYLNNLKIGDNVWGAETTFGSNITKYKVSEINRFPLNPMERTYQRSWMPYEQPNVHVHSIKEGLPQGIKVRFEVQESDTRYTYAQDVYFYNICKKVEYKDSSTTLYNRKPFKPEDIA